MCLEQCLVHRVMELLALLKRFLVLPRRPTAAPGCLPLTFSPVYPLWVPVFHLKGPPGIFPTCKMASGFPIPSNSLFASTKV